MATRTRKAPTLDELRTWRDFIETTELLRSRLESRLASDSSSSSGDYGVMLRLSEAPEQRLRSSHLADAMEWERSRLSHHLARMEKRGLVRREPCAEDQRGSEVVLTAEGSRAFRGSSATHLRAVRELFIDALTPEQLAAAGDIARALRAHLDA